MRLFTALELPPEVLLRLERLTSALRPEALINWSPLDNLHITTKFIGEWPESRLDEMDAALTSVRCPEPFEVEIKSLGWFPNDQSPRVLWGGVRCESGLEQLMAETEEKLAAIGIKKEEREFSPHLTLARIKHPVPLQRLRQRVTELQPTSFGVFPAAQFVLYQSTPGSNASIYRKLRQYRFEKALAAATA